MNKEMKLFFGAASANSISIIKKLLEKRIQINFDNVNGDNALNIAISNNHKDVVRLLIENGALVNKERAKISPLLLAVELNYKEIVCILIESGASLESAWLEGTKISPLQFTVRTLNYKMLAFLIEKGANACAKDPNNQRTALHDVGDFVDPNSPELHTRARVKLAKLLLKNGADICAQDKNGRTPLDGAIVDNAELSGFFIKEGAEMRRTGGEFVVEYVMLATKFDSPELIKLCLEHGSDYSRLTFILDQFTTAYHQALIVCTPEVVKVFWKFGCPINLPESGATFGPTPLEMCVEFQVSKENVEIVQIQLDFFRGIFRNNFNMVTTAIRRGAEPKGRSMQIPSPLHHLATVKNGDHKIAHVLLQHGVAVNILEGSAKKTCLFFSLTNNNLNVLKEILKFGGCFRKEDLEVLPWVKNKEIQTLVKEVMTAFKLIRKGSNKVLKRLKKCLNTGKKEMVVILMNCVDRQGRTLLNLALEKGHVKIAERLMKLRINHL